MKQSSGISRHDFGHVATSSVLAAVLAWAGMPAHAEVAEPLNPSSGNYYYAGGQKYVLPPSGEWVGVQVEPNTSNVLLKGVQSEAALDDERKPVRVGQDNLLLVPIDQEAAPAKKKQLKARLRRSSKVRRVLRTWAQGRGNLPMIDTGQFLVRFKPGITRARAQQILAQRGAVLEGSLGSIASNGYVARVANPQTTSSLAVAASLQESGQTVFSQPNFLMPMKKYAAPNDPLFTSQWHLDNTGQGFGTRGADVRALKAWDITTGDPNITIAIMDDGVDTDHEDFGASKLVPGYDALDDDNDPRPVQIDDNHGTACAGVAAAAGNNGIGVTGIAQTSKLMPIRMLAPFVTTLQIANSFRFAAQNGADVISNSWGSPVARPMQDVEKAAVDYATTSGRGGKGCVVLFAAGNDERSQDKDGYQSYERIISVAASTNRDNRAYYSNFGTTVDITAPSNGGSLGILTTDRMGGLGYEPTNYTGDFGGTSSACPLVAGVAALLLSKEPGLNYSQVRERLIQTADKIDPLAANYDQNGHSRYYGYGRVNAYRALLGEPPVTTLVTPADGAKVSGAVALSARTENDKIVTRVDFSARRLVASAKSTTLNLPIPDNNVEGVRSQLTLDDPAQSATTEANVYLDINHDYIGDLQVNLISPDGSREIVYDHAGGSADKLVLNRTLPLKNRPVKGTYTLEVIDDGAEDTGTLVAWGMVFTGPWINIGSDRDGATNGLWTATWNSGGIESDLYEVRAQAITEDSGIFSDSNTNIAVAGNTLGTFSISGRIVDNTQKPLANVPVSRGSVTVKTNANGEYTFAGVAAGSYTISPAQVGGVFIPNSRLVTVGSGNTPNPVGVNFIRSASDLIAPTITVIKPSNPRSTEPRSSYTSLPIISGTAADSGGSGLLRVTGRLTRAGGGGVTPGFYAGGTVWESKYDATRHERVAKGTTNWSLGLPALADGRYTFRATVYDRANNMKRSEEITFFIDRTAPRITIARPLANKVYGTELTSATGSASDGGNGGIEKVTGLLYRYAGPGVSAGYWNGSIFTEGYKAETNEVKATGTSTWSFQFPRQMAIGRYYFRASAQDRAGNTAKSTTVSFTIRGTTTTAVTVANTFSSAVASADQSTLSLLFTSALNADTTTFEVSVNGESIEIESVSVAGSKINLGLPEGALNRGDQVDVAWKGLVDAQGRAIADGKTSVTAP
ncbi:MAG: hypothetical protein JWN98_2577 [Abditibacteriota bacterium]|nr:hypothetical protein [Abditibacteriota bacterium]